MVHVPGLVSCKRPAHAGGTQRERSPHPAAPPAHHRDLRTAEKVPAGPWGPPWGEPPGSPSCHRQEKAASGRRGSHTREAQGCPLTQAQGTPKSWALWSEASGMEDRGGWTPRTWAQGRCAHRDSAPALQDPGSALVCRDAPFPAPRLLLPQPPAQPRPPEGPVRGCSRADSLAQLSLAWSPWHLASFFFCFHV